MKGPLCTVDVKTLDEALRRSPDYMEPILIAVRDYGCAWAVIDQHAGAYDLPDDRPLIALVGDDLQEALGPRAFHGPSMRRLLAKAKTVSIVAGAPMPLAYLQPAAFAVGLRVHGVIIETRPEQEAAWMALVEREAPDAVLTVVSVRTEGGAS